jgi:hypothetical protein
LGIINDMTMTPTARQTAVLGRFAKSYWLFGRILRKERDQYRLRPVPLVALHAVFPLLAVAAGYFDNTTRLLPRGRGVFEHYGFHALFISAPVLVLLAWLVVRTLAKVIAEPLPWLSPTASAGLTTLQQSLQDLAVCRSAKAKGLLLLMRTVGVFAVVANAASTRYPELVYGEDVFDSSRHALGYLAGRVFLGYYWIYLLPLIAYLAIATVVVAVRLASYVDSLPDYDIRCFASDGCGGFKELGRLMTLVVYLWVPIVAVVVALAQTHTNFYATLKLSAVLAVLIPAQLFLPFLRLHRVLTRLKERKLQILERFLTNAERTIDMKRGDGNDGPQQGLERSNGTYLRLLAGESIYRHTAAIVTWPYIKSDVVRWLTPFAPIVLSFAVKRLGLP